MHKHIFYSKFILLSIASVLLITMVTAAGDPVHGNLVFVEVKYGSTTTFQASAVEVSADGQFLYFGIAGGAIVVYKRDITTGRLLLVEHIDDEDFGLGLELFGVVDIVISPDGNHLYTCSYGGNTVVTFSRNATNGTLTYLGHVEDGVGDVDGLEGCNTLAITPDGNYLYAAGTDDNAIVRFERNSTTGLLLYLGAVSDGHGAVTEIAGVYGLAINPDGEYLYAAAIADNAVTTFQIDSFGDLSWINHVKDTDVGVDGLASARRIDVSPDGNHVYISSWDDRAVATLSVDNDTGALAFVEVDVYTDWLTGAYDVMGSPDGKHVYVCSYVDNTIVVFDRNTSNGRLNFIQRITDNTIFADGLGGAQQLAFSPDGSYLYVASRTEGSLEGAIAILRRSLETGKLTDVHTVESLNGVNGPVGIAVSPDGNNVYIANNNSNTLTVCNRDSITGKIREIQYFRDGHTADGLGGARAVAVSPDGGHVYVAGHSDDAIAIFDRHPADGGLVFYDLVQDSDLLIGGLDGIHSLTIDPGGGYVYTVSVGDDAMVVFNRNQTSGALTVEKTFYDGVAGVDGLNDAYHVAVSSDGGHVYVAGYSDDSVSHFEWTEPDGLEHRYTLKDGLPGGGDELNGANSLLLSPDDKYLYVASRNDDAISIFSVGMPPYRTLVYQSVVKDGVDGVHGLDGVRAIAMNASGTYLYAASQHENALAVFSRNITSGGLTYITHIEDTDPWIDGLATANGIAVSPIFNHIYVAAYDDDAVSVFNHFWGIYIPVTVRY